MEFTPSNLKIGWKTISHIEDTVTVEWMNGEKTEFDRKEYNNQTDCKAGCGSVVYTPRRLFLNDHCSPCYATEVAGVPREIKANGNRHGWVYPVDHTESASDGKSHYTDLFGNNFGVGDEVLFAPHKGKQLEGEVTELHQYVQFDDKLVFYYPDVTYGAKVDFRGLEDAFVPSVNLRALTDDHVPMDLSKLSDMEEVKMGFDPMQMDDLKPIFEDPVARAVWMGYRRSHVVSETHLNALNEASLNIARKVDEDIPKSRMGLWFNMQMRPSLSVSQEHSKWMVPYLTGEKEATYVVEEKVAA